ncbi:hypothetical protein BKA69DRAFT_1124962 [Paraphysoderma sedebokerense]|nr:hypothetical protein BKA69DRAFT_1124962 [Paraphysoderma sedebokerense]
MITTPIIFVLAALASTITAAPAPVAAPQLYVPPQYATGPSPGDDKPIAITLPPPRPAAKPSEFLYVTPPPPSPADTPARKPGSSAPAHKPTTSAPARKPTASPASSPRAQPK